MKRHTLILLIGAALMFAGAVISLIMEKKQAENELNELLNGKDTSEPDTGEPAEPDTGDKETGEDV